MKRILALLFLLMASPALAQSYVPDQRGKNGQMAMTNKPNTFQQSVVFKGNATINVTGSTQCLHVNSVGLITGTGSDCGAGGGGVSSLTGDSVVYNNSASTGAVTLSLATQTANKIFAGPSSGGAVAPTFRSLVGADLPNPAASTLGGVESLVATSHQWINTISTSGLPSSTQPAFTDISGAATTTQMPLAHDQAVTAFQRANQNGALAVPDQEAINGRLARVWKAQTWTALNNFTGGLQATTPTFVTNITDPLVIGGATSSSTLTLESTSGSGATDSIVAKTGSQATSQTWNSNGTTTLSKAGIDAQSTPAISTATFTPDFSAANHFIINLVHASCPCTLANPTNIVAGQSGVIAIVQSATGSDTITSWGSDYIFTNTTAPTLSTAANAIDYLSYYVENSTNIRVAALTQTNTGAAQSVNYQPGLLSAVNANIGVYNKIVNASTVDNIIGSAVTFTCASNPTVTMYECGTSATCTSPTTIGTVTITAAAQAFAGTVSNSAITAGDYIGFAMTSGTCASIDLAVTAAIHAN